MRRIFIIAMLAMIVTACAPDPRKQAEANRIGLEAQSRSRAMQQSLDQQQQKHDLFMAKIQEVGQWLSTLMMVTMIAAMFFVFVTITSGGIGMSFLTISAGISSAKRNLSMPNQIRLDPVTRQFPILPMYIGGGKYSLTNPNDNTVLLMDTANEADRMKVKAAFGIQHDGALAYQARLSLKPGEITSMQENIIEVTE